MARSAIFRGYGLPRSHRALELVEGPGPREAVATPRWNPTPATSARSDALQPLGSQSGPSERAGSCLMRVDRLPGDRLATDDRLAAVQYRTDGAAGFLGVMACCSLGRSRSPSIRPSHVRRDLARTLLVKLVAGREFEPIIEP